MKYVDRYLGLLMTVFAGQIRYIFLKLLGGFSTFHRAWNQLQPALQDMASLDRCIQ